MSETEFDQVVEQLRDLGIKVKDLKISLPSIARYLEVVNEDEYVEKKKKQFDLDSNKISIRNTIKVLESSKFRSAKKALKLCIELESLMYPEKKEKENPPETEISKLINELTYGEYRVCCFLDKDGNPWIRANDLPIIFGFTNPKETIRDNVSTKNTVKFSELLEKNYNFSGGVSSSPEKKLTHNQLNAKFINESGLYEFLFGIKKKSSLIIKFREWVCNEVLPSIRKTGSYSTNKFEKVVYDNINDYFGCSVVYLLHVKDNVYKYGISDKFDKRLCAHKNNLEYQEIVRLWKVNSFTHASYIETQISKQLDYLKISCNLDGSKFCANKKGKNPEYFKAGNDDITASVIKFIDSVAEKPFDEEDNVLLMIEKEKTKQEGEKTKQVESMEKTKREAEITKQEVEKTRRLFLEYKMQKSTMIGIDNTDVAVNKIKICEFDDLNTSAFVDINLHKNHDVDDLDSLESEETQPPKVIKKYKKRPLLID